MNSNPAAGQLYFSVEQVAQRFGVSKDTIWRWKREGQFPAAVRLGGGCTRWKLSDLENWEKKLTTAFSTSLDMSFYC